MSKWGINAVLYPINLTNVEFECILWLVFEPGNKSYNFVSVGFASRSAVSKYWKPWFQYSAQYLSAQNIQEVFMLKHISAGSTSTRPVRRIVAFVLMMGLTLGAASGIVSA